MKSTDRWYERIVGWQHVMLLAVLAVLHLVTTLAPETLWGRAFWLADVGLFLLWQPFISGQRRLGWGQSLAVIAIVGALGLQLGWGWLSLWTAFLAALVGGRVVMARSRRLRWFYLLAFAYLVAAMLVWQAPNIVPAYMHKAPAIDLQAHAGNVLIVLLLCLLPTLPRTTDRRSAEIQDFLASLLLLLLLSALMLGAIALMALRRIGYYDALVLALFGAAALLFLLNWAWGPRHGFSGLGASVSGYLLRIGLDFDRWIKRQLDLAESIEAPSAFLEASLAELANLPWVAGGEWRHDETEGRFGIAARHVTTFAYGGVSVKLYTEYVWSASLVWQANLLLKLIVELFSAKKRERRLRQMEYLQAVHEAGARVTHDIKNLLQSIEALCYAARETPEADAVRLGELIRRQLPALGQRLRGALDRLERKEAGDTVMSAELWWEELKRRFDVDGVRFEAPLPGFPEAIPAALFESAADNLIVNAIYKRQQFPAIEIVVGFAHDADGRPVFSVQDSGAAVAAAVVAQLFREPLLSASGMGIGLFQLSRQARESGYELRLAENADGAVRFELRAGRR